MSKTPAKSSKPNSGYSQLELFGDDDDSVSQTDVKSEPESSSVPAAAVPVAAVPVATKPKAAGRPKRAVKKHAKATTLVTDDVVSVNDALEEASVEESVIRGIDIANADLNRLRIDSPEVQAWAQPVEGDALATKLVRASAGTGKTYQLTARLLKILLQGAPPETVLATTFTRKAAGEILHRLLLTLANAADENNDAALEELRNQVEIETLPRSVCVQLLDTILRNVHRLRICTLDSLFAQLARSFPFELGLPAAWRLTDEIEEAWLKERAVESVVSSLDPGEMITVLSMLGKGDAKRSVAFELISVVDAAYSSQRQCGPDVWKKLRAPKAPEQADLTRAAGHMRQAEPKQKSLRERLEKAAELIELGQFSGLAHDTLISNIALARRNKAEVKFGKSRFPAGLDAAFDVLYDAVRSDVLSRLRAQNEATGDVLAAYDFQVTQLKQGLRTLGFEDVTVRLANQFRALDHRALASRMDGAINHLLLDEFQDTSPIQWQVLRPLARHAAAEPDSKRGPEWQVPRSFFCVGDVKQAIYGWRGGVAAIFDAVGDQIDGVQEVEQNTSYRSSPVVLDVVDRKFKNLHRHPMVADAGSKDLTQKSTHVADAMARFSRRFPLHIAFKKELPGYVRFETARKLDTKNIEQQRKACFEDAVAKIKELNAAAPNISIGVLTRSNKAVAAMIFLLDQAGVEVSQEGGNPLIDSAAVDLVLSALMMAEHPGDKRWAFHVQSSPLGESLGENGGDAIRAMVEDVGLSEAIEYLAAILAPSCDARDTLRLRQLTQLAMNYQRNAAPRLRDFVRMVREKRIERPQAAPVRVMTVHQSKGLEFDAVVLPELDGTLTKSGGGCVADARELGEPPHAMTRSINNKSWHFLPEPWQRAFGARVASEITESLCLLYVAMTRARQALYMFMPPTKKTEFNIKSSASLIYHALDSQQDATAGSELLFDVGDENWHQSSATASNCSIEKPTSAIKKKIQFQPLPDVPNRNK